MVYKAKTLNLVPAVNNSDLKVYYTIGSANFLITTSMNTLVLYSYNNTVFWEADGPGLPLMGNAPPLDNS